MGADLLGVYFFKVQDPKKISGGPDQLDIRVQIDWATKYIQSCPLSPLSQ